MEPSDFAAQHLDPEGYYREFVKNGVRVDGRSFSDLRRISVGAGDFSTSSKFGSSLIHIGETKIACGVSVLVGTPSQQYPDSGDIGKLT
jgi:exosome complex RNA-binding protein Rrp42 (RNase PH superfamily)